MSNPGLNLPAWVHEIPTPALLLDLTRLKHNCERGRLRCEQLGVRLRPHLKTAKSTSVARLAIDPACPAIAVSTLKEAEYFASEGFEDIQLAVCLPPHNLSRALALADRVARFSVFLDNVEIADRISARLATPNNPLGVWIEIDSGEHRTGILPDSPKLQLIAERLQGTNCARLEGVATHGGQSYDATSSAQIVAIAELERRAIIAAKTRLEELGMGVLRTSVGSTPTLLHSINGDGISEFRAGVYMFGDLYQSVLNGLPKGEIAISVLTRVISHSAPSQRFLVDAGGLALSKDRSTSLLGGADFGYGALLDIEGRSFHDLIINDVAQEHGFVEHGAMTPPPIGEPLRILPNHACMTAAMYDAYYVVEGQRVIARWPRVNGW